MAQMRRIKAKKRPEPVSGSGRVTHNPWFHLNSPLEAGHFVPDNGEARRSISAAQLQSAIPFFPEELSPAAPSLRLLKTELLCHSFYPVTVARFFIIVKENPAKEQKSAWNRRKRAAFFHNVDTNWENRNHLRECPLSVRKPPCRNDRAVFHAIYLLSRSKATITRRLGSTPVE